MRGEATGARTGRARRSRGAGRRARSWRGAGSCTIPIRVRCVLWPDGRVGGLQGAASFLERLWLASDSSGEQIYSICTVFVVCCQWGGSPWWRHPPGATSPAGSRDGTDAHSPSAPGIPDLVRSGDYRWHPEQWAVVIFSGFVEICSHLHGLPLTLMTCTDLHAVALHACLVATDCAAQDAFDRGNCC